MEYHIINLGGRCTTVITHHNPKQYHGIWEKYHITWFLNIWRRNAIISINQIDQLKLAVQKVALAQGSPLSPEIPFLVPDGLILSRCPR